MKVSKFKYLAIIIATIFVSLFCIFAIFSENAFAWDTNLWRPSIEIQKSIDATSSQINDCNKALEDSRNFIADYEANSKFYEENVNKIQDKFAGMEKFISEQRPELEAVTKNSYATFFAKNLLDEIIGNKLITDGLFHWGFVTFIACGEDDEIMKFVEDYYTTKSELEEAINVRDSSEANYQQSLENLEAIPNKIVNLNNNLVYLNNLMPQILEIENVYGAAGESRIEGENLFCHPCPGSSVSSPFGEQRDGYVHHGIDMCASSGTPIYAACDGLVFESGQNESMGNYIKIQHENGLVSVYMHCSHLFVPSGMHVCKGDNIALVGSTGDSEAPHLHFQVELNGTPVDGFNYL